MKFLELNKKRHAVKTFNDKAVDYKDLRTAIEIATLAPSANNTQPYQVIVCLLTKLSNVVKRTDFNFMHQAWFIC